MHKIMLTSLKTTVTDNKLRSSIINGSSVNFFKKGNIIFSVYYTRNNVNGYDVICEIQHGASIYYMKINDHAIIDRRTTNYPPEMLFVKNSNDDLIFIVIPEESKGRKALVIKIYKINYNPNVSLSKLHDLQLISCNNYLKEEVKYPIILHQDTGGRIVVIARVDNDYRGDVTDRLYVMWQLRYHNNRFEIIGLSNGYRQFNAAYLFKHSGYINRGKCHDRLIVKLGSDSFINFLYVGKHISRDYNFFSSIYDLSINYNMHLDPEECLVGSFYGCNASSGRKYNIPNSCIHVIDIFRDDGNVYIAYIGTVFNSTFKNKKQLVIVYTMGDEQSPVYDFMQITEDISAIYINSTENILAITTMGSDYLVKYEISKLQLKLGIVDHVDVIKIPRNVVKNIANFTYVVDTVLGFDSVEHINIRNVLATKSTVNDKVSQFFLNIREMEFGDLFKSWSGEYNDLLIGYTMPASYGVNYTTEYLSDVITVSGNAGFVEKFISTSKMGDVFKITDNLINYTSVNPTNHMAHVTLQSKLSDGEGITERAGNRSDNSVSESLATGLVLTSKSDDLFKSTASPINHAFGYVIKPTIHVTHVTLQPKSPYGKEVVRHINPKTDNSIHTSSIPRSILTNRSDGVFKSTASPINHAFGYVIKPTRHVTHVTLQPKSPYGKEVVRHINPKTDNSIHTSSIPRSVLTSKSYDVFKSTASPINHAFGYMKPASSVVVPLGDTDVSKQVESVSNVPVHLTPTVRSVLVGDAYHVSGSEKDSVGHEQDLGHGDVSTDVVLKLMSDNVSNNISRHVNNSLAIKHKILGRKVKYNIRRSTVRSGVNIRNKSTVSTRYTSHGIQEANNMNVTLFNPTQHNISSYNGSLLNSNSAFNTESSVDYKVVIAVISSILLIFLLLGGFKCIKWYLAKLNRRRMSNNEQGFVIFNLDSIQSSVSGVQVTKGTTSRIESLF
ncbi:hypothetical protein FDZ61_00815 [Ehrlichia ruminantium]|uniref:Uncharacterized protein n=2 Tax=Ehrlichia ruminantium TaxID=779 RepID=A0A0H3M0H1_EHRRW|nr:hypothetical protein FDZ62_00815 [Ehrlichia ruminantium]QLK55733.1 hypothetical protein FDZ61_00815 [Ehrlichia ruminantium]UOD99836.1 hypothetical protein IMW62_00825 [Ehrlichia ruminantium]CAH57859.1 hypothetical protein Erum1430 [Ehrlichia ruminantium str. Welgevonden]CAI26633.1 Hypothetical protein ERWE_CDS_01390 [Ehrlichia ruminantium str. Welgevonden]